MDKTANDLGQWMGQYLLDNGYTPHTTSVMMKQMFMASFPPLWEEGVNEENLEPYLLKTRKVLARYAEQEEKNTASKTLAKSPFLHASGWW